MFASFTEEREEAEEYGREWRTGIPVIFELRSALCPRLQNGTHLLHPFALLRVEAVAGNVVKLVGVELLEPGRVRELPGRRPGVVPKDGALTELHKAAERGDVRAIARFATRPEWIDARDADGWTPLAVASGFGQTEAVKALLWLGANVSAREMNGATALFLASQKGHESIVRILVSFGANVNTPVNNGMTPLYIASQSGHEPALRVLASLGANVNAPNKDGATPVFIASQEGHEPRARTLALLGADVNAPQRAEPRRFTSRVPGGSRVDGWGAGVTRGKCEHTGRERNYTAVHRVAEWSRVDGSGFGVARSGREHA
jgi:hypothetical protein